MIVFHESDIKANIMPCINNGSGTHLIGKCPWCSKDGHFYVQKKTSKKDNHGNNATGSFGCKKCGENGRYKKLLFKLKLGHLISSNSVSGNIFEKLTKIQKKTSNSDLIYDKVEEITLPLGYKRELLSNNYFEKRGIDPEQYNQYNIGTCSILHKWKKYVFFIVEEEKRPVAWVARCIESREWIDEENKKRRSQGLSKILRYENSRNDLSKILLGFDEVVQNITKTVILVEGAFSKVAVDRKLKLYKNEKVKCLCTFGKTLSKIQYDKIIKKNVENIIIMYDGDALSDIKKYLSMYESKKVNIYGARLPNNKDPDDVSTEVLISSIKNRKKSLGFNLKFLKKI